MKSAFQVTEDIAAAYFKGTKKHRNYERALDVFYHLSFHFDGYFQKLNDPYSQQTNIRKAIQNQNEVSEVNPYFIRLIDMRRPSESPIIQAYRRSQYRPITKVPCGKVVNCLKKIVKSSDWKISYDKAEIPATLNEEDALENYCEKHFPKDGSVENWAYKTLIRWLIIDPNALVCTMPISFEMESNEYPEPYPFIIPCKNVLDFKYDTYAAFIHTNQTQYVDQNGVDCFGKIVIIVTTEMYYQLSQNGDDKDKFDTLEYRHNLGYLPCVMTGGESKSPDFHAPYYESFVQSMLPSLDTVAADVSDLAAEKTIHLFSLMWHIQTQVCSDCQGMGFMIAEGKQSICPTCEGRGAPPMSPYRTLEINPNSTLKPDLNFPTPPAGYIEKSTEIIKEMREIIKDGIYDALAAVNMEHLSDIPLAESGVSKSYDQEETNNFVYSVAYHLVVELLVPTYGFINDLRYSLQLPEKNVRDKMLPNINVPEKYDFLTQMGAEDDLIKITSDTNGVSDEIKDAAEMNYVNSKFQDSPMLVKRLNIIHDHNPLPGFTVDELESMVTTGFVAKEDAILAVYLKTYVAAILAEDDTAEAFLKLDFEGQKKQLMDMAAQKAKDLEAAQQIKLKAAAAMNQKIDADGNPVKAFGKQA